MLIVGGGDGGAAREATKHDSVESITVCEIDQVLLYFSLKFLLMLRIFRSKDTKHWMFYLFLLHL